MDPVIDQPAPAADAVVTPDTSPEATPTPAPETPENVTPEAAPAAPDNVAIYQDVVAKFNEDNNYEMTAAEADAFVEVGDLINDKKMEVPPPKKLDASPDTAPDKPEKTPAPEDKGDEDKPADEEKPEGDKPPADSVSDSMLESMKKVGAKDVTELPAKIESLIRNRDESGGKLGSENAALKTKIGDLEKAAQSHIAWLNDLKEGKPAAVEYLNKLQGDTNGKPAPVTESGEPAPDISELGDMDEFLDDKLAAFVKKQATTIETLTKKISDMESKDKSREDDVLTTQATIGWVDDVVKLVTNEENQAYYGLSANEARGLAEQYFDKKLSEEPVHPKMQKVHELILYAHEKGLPTLGAAHVVKLHESGHYAKQIVESIKKGQQQFKPSVNSEMSESQSRKGNNVPEPAVSDDTISRIEKGNFDEIPDEWMDKQGNLIPEKVPERFHDKAFGRAGKPKR